MAEPNPTKPNHSHPGLEAEVVSLFGEWMVQQAKMLKPDALAVEADQVAEGARQLREHSGHPDRQRAVIRAMDDETAIALCQWIREPSCMAKFIARGLH